jgi:hypothetical protein
MKAAVASVPLRAWLLKKPAWLDHQTEVGLIFAVKTFAASLLALYIAFWTGLDDPRWSFLTVFAVSQPDSGLVLAKSFYRILGLAARRASQPSFSTPMRTPGMLPPTGLSSPRTISTFRRCSNRLISRAPRRVFSINRCAG